LSAASAGTDELEKLVNSGEYACAFSMFPTSVADLDEHRRHGRIDAAEKHLVRAEIARRHVLPHDLNLCQPNRTERSLRATFLGMGVNVLLVAGKLAGGMARPFARADRRRDGIAGRHLQFLIVWRAVVVAAEPPDRDHPYGHGKAEAIAAAIASTILLLAALGIAIQAARQLFQPREPPRAFTLLF
jgi:hypothetical protein